MTRDDAERAPAGKSINIARTAREQLITIFTLGTGKAGPSRAINPWANTTAWWPQSSHQAHMSRFSV